MGDANHDGVFDQFDVVQVAESGKYLTGASATWEEGDWTGDGRFDQHDIVAALQTGDYRADRFVRFRLETTSPTGEPIDSVVVGEAFVLHVYVQDIRDNPSGLFAAYLDVLYDSSLVAVDGEVEYSADFAFPDPAGGNTDRPGIVDEVGAISGLAPPGGEELLLLSVPIVAGRVPGTASFRADPADDSPLHDVLFFNPVVAVPRSAIEYGDTTVVIVGGASV